LLREAPRAASIKCKVRFVLIFVNLQWFWVFFLLIFRLKWGWLR
jgi:hypothetical protein